MKLWEVEFKFVYYKENEDPWETQAKTFHCFVNAENSVQATKLACDEFAKLHYEKPDDTFGFSAYAVGYSKVILSEEF